MLMSSAAYRGRMMTDPLEGVRSRETRDQCRALRQFLLRSVLPLYVLSYTYLLFRNLHLNGNVAFKGAPRSGPRKLIPSIIQNNACNNVTKNTLCSRSHMYECRTVMGKLNGYSVPAVLAVLRS